MKNKVVLKIPLYLSGDTDVINLSPPCTCCGAPVVESPGSIWHHSERYFINHWVKTVKFGDDALGKVLDASGHYMAGQVEINAPYCVEHQIKQTIFGKVYKIAAIVGALAGEVASLLNWFIFRSGLKEFSFLGNALLGPVCGVILCLLLALVIGDLITVFKPKLVAYPKDFGFWGLRVFPVQIDSGKTGIGPIQYFQPLGFYNVDTARRFIKDHPQAIVTEGQKNLDKLV